MEYCTSSLKIKKNLIAYFISFLLVSLLIQCNSSGTFDKKNVKDSATLDKKTVADDTLNPPLVVDGGLNILYISANKMHALIRDVASVEEGKLVFQFYINSSGRYSLIAFSGDQHHLNFDDRNAVELINSNLIVGNMPLRVFLGDQEISKQNPDNGRRELKIVRQEIRRHRTVPPAPPGFIGFITFSPIVNPSSVRGIPNSFKIDYELGYASSIAEIENPLNLTKEKATITTLGFSLNPCPPHNGY